MAHPSLKLTLADDELRSRFLALKTRDDVADLLDVPLKTLCFYAYKKQNYLDFAIPKKSGQSRIISAPHTALKIIQRKLSQVLYAVYGSRGPVHGFARDRSIKSNATVHLGSTWVLNFDLKDFFSSIHFGRVAGMFAGKPYMLPKDIANFLAQLCCHNGALPTGAPTSPIVANMIAARLDSQLKTAAWASGCKYTRYADDMTFSTRQSVLPQSVVLRDPLSKNWVLSAEIVTIIESNSFAVNPYKTRVRSRHSTQEVTGVRINSGLNVSKDLLRQIRMLLRVWEKHGETIAQDVLLKRPPKGNKNQNPKVRDVLLGKIEFVGFVRGRQNRSYVKLLQRYQACSGFKKPKPIAVMAGTHTDVIQQAVWLLYDKHETVQGSAFAVEGGCLLTAAHNLDDFMWASRPGFDPSTWLVTQIHRDDERDIASVSIDAHLPVVLRLAGDVPISLGSKVCVIGFPHHHVGDSVAFRDGRVVQERKYLGVPHFIVDADIVKGNSGGPVLDEHNKVLGIAVKGLSTPGTLTDGDQLSSFIPITKELFPNLH